MSRDDFLLENEPARFTKEDVDRLLLHCALHDASDIILKTNAPVFIQRHARYYRVSRRALSDVEVGFILNDIYGANGTSIIKSAQDIDRSHEIRYGRNDRVRFRMNATSCLVDGTMGAEITLRVIKSVPPLWETLDIEQAITDGFAPLQGMVLVTGETGSGKSTLLASNNRRILETPDNDRRILTYESPVEYVYDEIDCELPLITQTEIGRNLGSFEDGIRNSLRRNPSIIMIGESRDRTTMEQSIVAANSGHLLYTTIHSSGPASTMRRMANLFPDGERDAKMVDIMEALRMVVTQRLLPSVDGGRVAVREFLVFDHDIKNRLYKHRIEEYPIVTQQLVREFGQPMVEATERMHRDGRVSDLTLASIRRISEGTERGLLIEAEAAKAAAKKGLSYVA